MKPLKITAKTKKYNFTDGASKTFLDIPYAGSGTIIVNNSGKSKKYKSSPKGEQTSLAAELYAIKKEIRKVPKNSEISIYIDSTTAISIIKQKNATNQKTKHKEIVDIIKQTIKERTATTNQTNQKN